jgi:hypothetical protein
MAYDQGGNCWNCGATLTVLDYGRADTCLKCGKDTKVCKNCVFFDPNYNNQCIENQADRVVEKERSNFCDYFKPKAGGGSGTSSRDSLKAAADALFKK